MPRTSNDSMLEVKGITKDYRLGKAVIHAPRRVDFSVSRGDFVSIVSPSGRGKTTLLNIIGCIDEPSSGHVRIDNAKSANALNPLGFDTLIPDAEELVDRIRPPADPRIVDVEPLLSFGGLLVENIGQGDPRNLAMRGIGVRPETRFADNVRHGMVAGAFFCPVARHRDVPVRRETHRG